MQRKFDLNLHKRYLVQLLVEVFKVLDGKIAFKGGTCAYLFYNLKRFSFDLDFDVLEGIGKKEIDKIKTMLSRQGEIKDFYEKRNTIFFLFSYQKGYPNIKIEFNKRIFKKAKYKTIWFLGIEMKIMDEATMFATKLLALSQRKTPVPRDLFDVNFFLNLSFPINKELIKDRASKDCKDYLTYLIRFIKKTYNEKNILQGLGEILDEKQKRWVKENLIKDTISKLR